MIYLDNAATTMPKPPAVLQAVQDAMTYMGSLGRSGHKAAELASETAFNCRKLAGELFDAQPEQVVFTFNATHGLNIAIKTLVSRGDKVVVSGFEHNAVLRPLHRIGANVVIAGRKLFDQRNTVSDFSVAIDSDTKAVICTHVSNVFGYILPIEEIAEICRQRSVPLVIDAAQSAGILPLSLQALGAAFIAMPGHKGLFGPQGTGLLLCGSAPRPLLEGGTGSLSKSLEMPEFLPDLLEAGTQNIHGIAGLLEGLRYVKNTTVSAIKQHEKALIKFLESSLEKKVVHTYYSPDEQSGVISMLPTGDNCEAFAQKLSDGGFAVRSGFHCAPVAHESAGTYETGTVRVSVSAVTKAQEIEEFADYVNKVKK